MRLTFWSANSVSSRELVNNAEGRVERAEGKATSGIRMAKAAPYGHTGHTGYKFPITPARRILFYSAAIARQRAGIV